MSSSWTDSQNKLFENALAIYDKDTPDRWQKVAQAVGCGKTAEDVKRHYKWLDRDVQQIESGEGSQGSHSSCSGSSGRSSNSCGRNNGDKSCQSPGLLGNMQIQVNGGYTING